jgi:hypothetical protein
MIFKVGIMGSKNPIFIIFIDYLLFKPYAPTD